MQGYRSLTKTYQAQITTVEAKDGKMLAKKEDVADRWREYCLELYNHTSHTFLTASKIPRSR